MRIPKTPIEFDYDLWTTEDGKCMVRVKATKEECEVSREAFRLLRAEEKRLRRSYSTSPSREDTGEERQTSDLSLDALPDDDVKSAAWLADPRDYINDIEFRMLEADLMRDLTSAQLEIYKACVICGQTPTEYAQLHNMRRQSVNDAIKLIRKKAKKYF